MPFKHPKFGLSMTFRLHGRPGSITLGAIILVAVGLRLSLGPHVLDDAYITFRYAQNLARGQGFVYNHGEQVLGTTTPLFALLLAAGFRGALDPEAFSFILNLTSDVVLIAVLCTVCSRMGRPLTGAISALMLAISAQFVTYTVSGMETSFYVASLVASWGLYASGYPLPAFAVAGLSSLVRPDALLMTCALYVDWLRHKRRLDLRPIVITLAVVGPWLLFATVYFGSPVPMSVQAKAADAAISGGPIQSIRALQVYFLSPFNNPAGNDKNLLLTSLFALGSCAILEAVWQRLRDGTVLASEESERLLSPEFSDRLFPLLLWSMMYLVAFTSANALTIFPWYYIPLYPAYFMIAIVGLGWLAERMIPQILARLRPSRWGDIALIPLILLVIVLLPARVREQRVQLDNWITQREGAYRRAADYVVVNSAQDQRIGASEIGAVGYYSQRYIVDVHGLVTPRHQGEGPVETFIRHEPEWLIDGEYGVSKDLSSQGWFQTRYRQVWHVPGTAVRVFRLRTSASP